MKVLDPGHTYLLNHLDGKDFSILSFVKREGPGYPGNVGHHEGTNLQEVMRVCIDRLKYLNQQIPDESNDQAIEHLRFVIRLLEYRAAYRHDRPCPKFNDEVELQLVCQKCGHIGCADSIRLNKEDNGTRKCGP